MRFRVHPNDGLPIYRQIMKQIVDAIAGGSLGPGSQLPSHRELSQSLVVAPLTVKKAYDELERAGYIRMQRGQGSFVTGQPELSEQDKLSRLQPLVQQVAAQASLLGVGEKAVRGLLKQAIEEQKLRNATAKPEGRSS